MTLITIVFLIFVSCLVLYPVAVWLVPKGNLVHEFLYLPIYWTRHQRMPVATMQEQKISYGPHRHQYFLYFQPPASVPAKNIFMFYFHGGSWRYGRPRYFKANASFFAQKGYHVLLPSHRHPPKFKFDAIRKDLIAMLRRAKRLSADQEIFNVRYLFGGMSSGGHLAMMMRYDKSILESAKIEPHQLRGILVCGAPLNFNLLPDTFILKGLGGPRSGELFQEANPMNHLDPNIKTPILCFHGEKDGIIALVPIKPFIEELEAHQHPLQFHVIPKGNHMSATRLVILQGYRKKNTK